jgi:hypothetical protein
MRAQPPPPPSTTTTTEPQSFGWGDFPLVISEDLPLFEASSAAAPWPPSVITDSTADETLYEDDSLPEEDEEVPAASPGLYRTVAASGSTPPQRQVKFGSVHVRQHSVVLGDHPLAWEGYPLALGWDYTEATAVPLDAYEASRSTSVRGAGDSSSSGSGTPPRLSTLARRFKLADMNGGNLSQVDAEEETRRREAATEDYPTTRSEESTTATTLSSIPIMMPRSISLERLVQEV